ncbi:MAG: hypothetical protein FWB75_05195 [Oscillospiraceae bacterium]|nr:hypothetical protein [Oscillospiraceae bacterium]
MSIDQEITMKNTKAEMLEALNEALTRAKAAESGKLNPVKVEKEKSEKKAVESAKAAVEQSIFSVELNNKFKDLQTAISTEEARLQELYGVSSELQKLALIIEAGRERQVQIDAENAAKIEYAASSLDNLRAEYAQKKTELQEEYDTLAKKLKIERTREAEEFQYNLRREREKETFAWDDEKNAREAALARKEELAALTLSDAEAKAEHLKTLEAKVESIPELIESEKKAAVELACAELTREHNFKIALSDKDYQNSSARQNDKISHLEKELEAANKANVSLQNKLDKAYSELRELATKTVESASGVKIIGGSTE